MFSSLMLSQLLKSDCRTQPQIKTNSNLMSSTVNLVEVLFVSLVSLTFSKIYLSCDFAESDNNYYNIRHIAIYIFRTPMQNY